MVKSLGAMICFDQKDSTLFDRMVAYLNDKDIVGALHVIHNDTALDALRGIIDRIGGKKLMASVIQVQK